MTININARLRERLTDIKAEIALLESISNDLHMYDAGHRIGQIDAMRAELEYWLPILAPSDTVGDWLQSLHSES
jgi:hypothetical protein